MRRLAGGEEPVADDGMSRPAGAARCPASAAGRPGAAGRWCPSASASQASAAGSVGPSVQNGGRHRQQRVQIERAGRLRPIQADRLRVMRLDALRGTAAPGCGSRRPSAAARSGGCATARLKTSSSMRAKSSRHGMTPGAARRRGEARDLRPPAR